jgi:hypothetical protein
LQQSSRPYRDWVLGSGMLASAGCVAVALAMDGSRAPLIVACALSASLTVFWFFTRSRPSP